MREHIDLPTVDALDAEWRRHPPVHHLVAAYLGYKAPAASSGGNPEPEVGALLAEMGDVPIRKVNPIDTSAFDALMQQKREQHG